MGKHLLQHIAIDTLVNRNVFRLDLEMLAYRHSVEPHPIGVRLLVKRYGQTVGGGLVAGEVHANPVPQVHKIAASRHGDEPPAAYLL